MICTPEKCSHYFDANGKKVAMTTEKLNQIENHILEGMASKCYRTLAFAYCDYSAVEWNSLKEANNNFGDNPLSKSLVDTLESNLTIICIGGIEDPLKDGIKNAVLTLKKAGVNTRMVTGDSKSTAIAIAIEAGIVSANWKNEKVGEDGDPEQNDYEKQRVLKYTCMTGKEFIDETGGHRTEEVEIDGKTETRDVMNNINKFR